MGIEASARPPRDFIHPPFPRPAARRVRRKTAQTVPQALSLDDSAGASASESAQTDSSTGAAASEAMDVSGESAEGAESRSESRSESGSVANPRVIPIRGLHRVKERLMSQPRRSVSLLTLETGDTFAIAQVSFDVHVL